MRNVEIKLTLNKKDDGEYAVLFMGAEVISFSESVYKTDGDKIYEALVNMFAKEGANKSPNIKCAFVSV
jgi:hypothetical protein